MKDFIITQKENNSIKVRESGIELLRILSIFFVVVIHEIATFLPADNLFVVISRIISGPAIFSFAFITGYFLILKKDSENKITRFLWLSLEIIIGRVVISFIFLLVTTLGTHDSAAAFFTNFLNEVILTLVNYKLGYFGAIIFIYLVFPFFTSYLNNNYRTGKKLLRGILIFLIVISILATIAFFVTDALGYNFSIYQDQYTIFTVLLASVLGAYWHLIEQEKKIEYHGKMQLIGLVGLLVIYLINFSCMGGAKSYDAVLSYLNIFGYLAGWCYFLIFKGFNFHNKFINGGSNLSGGIYILHNGGYLPRGGAFSIADGSKLDLYSSTILTIFLCYFLAIILVLAAQNFDKFVVKPYIIENLKTTGKKHKSKKLQVKKSKNI